MVVFYAVAYYTTVDVNWLIHFDPDSLTILVLWLIYFHDMKCCWVKGPQQRHDTQGNTFP